MSATVIWAGEIVVYTQPGSFPLLCCFRLVRDMHNVFVEIAGKDAMNERRWIAEKRADVCYQVFAAYLATI